MTYTISRASVSSIPSLVNVLLAAFSSPAVRSIYPDSPPSREWHASCFNFSLTDPVESQNTIYMIATEDATGEIVALSKWIVVKDGEKVKDWKERHPLPVAVDMSEEKLDAFLGGMKKQHEAVMGERAHYFLEILGTLPEYHRKGIASKLLQWGCEMADEAGIDSYLDASVAGKPLYERFGYEAQVVPGSTAAAVAMIRPAKVKEGEL